MPYVDVPHVYTHVVDEGSPFYSVAKRGDGTVDVDKLTSAGGMLYASFNGEDKVLGVQVATNYVWMMEESVVTEEGVMWKDVLIRLHVEAIREGGFAGRTKTDFGNMHLMVGGEVEGEEDEVEDEEEGVALKVVNRSKI